MAFLLSACKPLTMQAPSKKKSTSSVTLTPSLNLCFSLAMEIQAGVARAMLSITTVRIMSVVSLLYPHASYNLIVVLSHNSFLTTGCCATNSFSAFDDCVGQQTCTIQTSVFMSSLPDNNGAAALDSCPDVVHGKFQGVCKKPSSTTIPSAAPNAASSSSDGSFVESSLGLIVGIAAAGVLLLGGAAYFVFTMSSGAKSPALPGHSKGGSSSHDGTDDFELKRRGTDM